MTAALPIVIGGPTASGKSAVALALAEALDGEIICADSRQLYAGMAVASAQPTAAERARVPHHLYGSVDPRDVVTAGAWAALADDVTASIQARGRVPIIVGGTGLYLRAWRVGLVEPSDPAVRARLEGEAGADGGLAVLYARLVDADPGAAAAIAPADRLRIVRALEILEVKGAPRGAVDLSTLPARRDARWLLVDAPLEILEPRIRARAVAMWANGIVGEARALAERLGSGHRLLQTIGVQEALDLADAPVESAVSRIAVRTRQYARRQRTWFKKEPWWSRVDASSKTVVEDSLSMVRDPR